MAELSSRPTLAGHWRPLGMTSGTSARRSIRPTSATSPTCAGAIEGDADGGSETDQSNKMANSIGTNQRLRKT